MLDDLLQMLMQSQQGQSSNQQQPQQPDSGAGDPLGDLLGGILGGMGGQAGASGLPQPANAGGGDMGMLGGLLDMVMGGGATSGATGVTGGLGGNPMLAPITEALSEKLGISPQMAAVIVSAGFALLMSKMQQAGQPGNRSGSVQDLDLDELTDAQFLQQSGVASRVAQQTGLDEDTAVDYLQQATRMMAGGSAETPAAPAPSSQPTPKQDNDTKLDGLLDTWETD